MPLSNHQLDMLRDIMGAQDVHASEDSVYLDGRSFPIVDDVVVFLRPDQYTPYIWNRLRKGEPTSHSSDMRFAEDIQHTFGAEWSKFPELLPEHEAEFRQYFNLVDLKALSGKRLCDMGCGNGRWSHFLQDYCQELILVDFSDAIFTAKKNLRSSDRNLFVMADLLNLPFRRDFCDFIASIGVLHHLPIHCLEAARRLKDYAPESLFFLYYALDNRPVHYRWLLKAVTLSRVMLSSVRHEGFRTMFSWFCAFVVYKPLILLGEALRFTGKASAVPLFDFYQGKSLDRIRQDVYDRFFTRIEQRVAREQILALRDSFSEVTVSDTLPYWHFLCKR